MKRNILILVILMLTIFFRDGYTQSKSNKQDGKWISIFNGKNLDGWTPKVTGYKAGENPLNGFRVEDGILRVDYSKFAAFNGRFGHLFYKQKLSSFILHVEYRFVGEHHFPLGFRSIFQSGAQHSVCRFS